MYCSITCKARWTSFCKLKRPGWPVSMAYAALTVRCTMQSTGHTSPRPLRKHLHHPSHRLRVPSVTSVSTTLKNVSKSPVAHPKRRHFPRKTSKNTPEMGVLAFQGPISGCRRLSEPRDFAKFGHFQPRSVAHPIFESFQKISCVLGHLNASRVFVLDTTYIIFYIRYTICI